jgi:hypothetical protein
VWRSDVGGRNRDGAGSVAEQVQRVPDVWQPPLRAARDVLDDDEARRDLPDDLGEVPPEAASLASDASALAGARDVLAGEASANKVNVRPSSGLRDIFKPRHIRPVLREHAPAKWVQLALPQHRTEAGAF